MILKCPIAFFSENHISQILLSDILRRITRQFFSWGQMQKYAFRSILLFIFSSRTFFTLELFLLKLFKDHLKQQNIYFYIVWGLVNESEVIFIPALPQSSQVQSNIIVLHLQPHKKLKTTVIVNIVRQVDSFLSLLLTKPWDSYEYLWQSSLKFWLQKRNSKSFPLGRVILSAKGMSMYRICSIPL